MNQVSHGGRFQFAARIVLSCALLAGALLAPVPARAFNDEEVRAIVGNEKQPSDFPGAGGVWMARQRSIQLDGAGNASITEHLIARVFDPSWAEARFTPYTRTYWSQWTALLVDRARVWHGWDRVEDVPATAIGDSLAEAARGVRSARYMRERRISFPRLQAGDVVEIRLFWSVRIPNYDYNVRSFEEVFGAEDPVIEQQLILELPQAAQVRLASVGPEVPKSESFRDSMRRILWMTGNLPASTPHLIETPWSRVPSERDSLPARTSRVLFTTFKEWKDVSAYFGRQWESSWNQRSPEMDRILAEVGVTGKPKDVVARDLGAYVRAKVRTVPVAPVELGMFPVPAGEIASEGAGTPRDKTCLMVALLRMAGVRAFPVLVRTRGGAWDPDVPTLAQLDRYVVRADIPGGPPVWLDAAGAGRPLPPGRGVIFHGAQEGQAGQDTGLVPFPGLAAE